MKKIVVSLLIVCMLATGALADFPWGRKLVTRIGSQANATIVTPSSLEATSLNAAIIVTNNNRTGAIICNPGANDAWLSISRAAAGNKGIYLKSGGGTYEINATNLTFLPINVIMATDVTTNISYQEFSK